jgi:flagellum-specific peptidoglycan hydrolase FlgJ
MQTSILATAIVVFALSAPIVSAQEKTAPAGPATSMGMDKQMPQMHENMEKMQQQMEKLAAATDPKERQKLMQEHMQSMHENMKTMRAMDGPMMMGSSQKDDMAQHGGMNMTGDDLMAARQDMMEKRMDMMQMMMEQMIQHDQAMESMPAR